MASEQSQFDIKKILRWFVKEEVKTPLAFFFKIIPYMTAAWVAVLYAPGLDGALKYTIIKFSAWIFLGLTGLVAVLALLKPRSLLYGEAGHRAERKLEFGTEKRTYTAAEFDKLESTRDPQQLGAGGE